MIEAIVQAAQIPLMRVNHEPFETPMQRQSMVIVGGTHLIALAALFPRYAVKGTVLVPQELPAIEAEMELRRAVQLEETTKGLCSGSGLARDLSGIDTDAIDTLIISCIYPSVREAFLAQAWRVVRELGKVIIFTTTEIPLTHLASYGVAAPKYFPAEGFYVGTMRKGSAIRAKN